MGLKNLTSKIVDGKLEEAVSITANAINNSISPIKIMEYMVAGMDEIGARFEDGKAYVPNLLMSSRAMKGCLKLIGPLLKEAGAKPKGKVVIGTIKGDLHDIGKNILAAMLEGAGFEIINLGVDVSPEKFAETAKNEDAEIIAVSALLTTTMINMKAVVEACETLGIRDQVKIIVGGAPLSQKYCDSIHADGYSSNGNGAVRLAKELVS